MYMYILLHVYVVLPRYCCYVRFKVISLSNHLIALSLSLSLSLSPQMMTKHHSSCSLTLYRTKAG